MSILDGIELDLAELASLEWVDRGLDLPPADVALAPP